MTTKKLIRIDFSNNADLKEVFSRKEVGDECELTIRIQVNELTPEYVSGTILEIEADDYGDKDEGPIEPSGEKPVSINAVA